VADAEYEWLYVGTFTRTSSKGIYSFRLDMRTGKLTSMGLAAKAVNPSFLAIHPERQVLYAVVNEDTGLVSAYRIDPRTAALTLVNRVRSEGAGPCFLALSNSANMLLAANYRSGSAVAFPVREDSGLQGAAAVRQHAGRSAHPERQSGPHTHSLNPSPDDRFAIAVDLGVDKLYIYRLGKDGLEPNDPPFVQTVAGAGPRHFAFGRSGPFGYLVNELNSTVTVYGYDARRGSLEEIQTLPTIPGEFAGTNYPADIHVHPCGRFVYVSNRGYDAITLFAIHPTEGRLAPLYCVPTQGKTPRNFAIDPAGRWLVVGNEDSDNLMVFRIDPETGRLAAKAEAFVPSPTCIQFVPQPWLPIPTRDEEA
jgi:6-phosphogluconolactonase